MSRSIYPTWEIPAQLIEPVIIAACKVQETQIELNTAKEKKLDTWTYSAMFREDRVEERGALVA